MRISDWSSDVCSSDLVAKSHILYQCHDVTALIAQGDNAIGAIVGDGWYASPFGWRIERYGFGPAPRRFRAQIRLDYGDGCREWIATGPDWTIAPSPILTSEIYAGEHYYARSDLEPEHVVWGNGWSLRVEHGGRCNCKKNKKLN